MSSSPVSAAISVMLAVSDTPAALAWYKSALGAREMWNLGSVAGLEIGGAPFFLHEPVESKFDSPKDLGSTTARVEFFIDDPDAMVAMAVKAGATGHEMRDHTTPWGLHRQGGFTDPFGHVWLVGDKSPLQRP